MASFIELIAKIKQKNNGTFKLVDAQDVECEDGKGLDEVLNEKLDKNQGAENKDKVLVTDVEGNITTQNKEDFEGGGTSDYKDLENKPSINGVELIGNKTSGDLKMYTQEEVDYMLADKMDKPYVPIEITDNATITDALEGNFKIDKIKGNTYQNVETDIVPTPTRPVPINSRKVKAGEEYVELRSLKETSNMFDYRLYALLNSEYVSLNDDGTGIKILKPDDRDISEIPYELDFDINTYLNFMWDGENGQGIKLYVYIKHPEQDWQEFSTVADGTLKAQIGVGNDEPIKMRFKFVGVTGAEKTNIGLFNYVLGDITYIPPTVRDYKIVDHHTQTAKIIRNVGLYVDDKTGDGWNTYVNEIFPNSYFKNIKDMKKSNRIVSYSNSFEVYDKVTDNANSMWIGVSANSNVFVVKTDFTTLDEWKSWLKNNGLEFLYPLAAPVEESIAYVETDTNEVGYSWQDTTSPSPTIPAEIKGVDKIDITVTGKNLFDVDYVSNLKNWTNSNTDGYFYIPIKVPKGKQLCLSNDKTIASGRDYYANFSPYKDKNVENYYFFYHNTSGSAYGKFDKLTKDEVIYLRLNSITVNLSLFIEDFKHLQLEVGETATAYKPYTEQHVNITPPQPQYSTLDGSIADEVDVEKGVYRYWLLRDKIGNVIDSVMLGSLNGDMQKYFTDTLQDESRVPLSLNDQYDTRNLLCTNYNANIESYMNASNETFSLYMDTTAKFVGCVNIERLNENTTSDIYNFIKDFEIVYPLETPIEIPIPQEDLKLLKSLKTEQGVTNIFVGGEVKPTIEARYPRDLALVQQQLEQKILLISDSLIDTQAKVLLQGGN